MKTPLPKRTDPRELRAILALERDGWEQAEILEFLGMSLRTYYRRKAEIRRIKERSKVLSI